MTTRSADQPANMQHPTPGRATNEKPLHVHQFVGGAVAITCKGMALHLREEEAVELLVRLAEIFRAPA